mmetsp:Transcript_11162/g.22407  ORF Transcript_11162/g.22407 Transcript_11162/m.22407 type:complete len:496 (+) Transcript_11162:238-1725(+)
MSAGAEIGPRDGPGVGSKRPRTSVEMKPSGMGDAQYLQELLAEYERHKKLEGDMKMPHSERLVLAQIDAISNPSHDGFQVTETIPENWNGDQGDGIRTELVELPKGSAMKFFVPEEVAGDVRGGSTRGRLLGFKGQTMASLQEHSRTKMSIKGKGSVKFKDGSSEESHMHEEHYAHLKEPLHVYAVYEGLPEHRDNCFAAALRLVRTVVTGGTVPPPTSSGGNYGQAAQGGGQAQWLSLQGGGGLQLASASDCAFAASAAQQGQIASVVSSNKEIAGLCKTGVKIFIPQRTSIGDSRGRLLGQKGATLKQLQLETGLRLSIRGKGSMRLPGGAEEVAMLATPQYAHLNEELHVLMEYEGPLAERDQTINSAELLIRAMLTPSGKTIPGVKHAVSQYEAMKHQQQQLQQGQHQLTSMQVNELNAYQLQGQQQQQLQLQYLPQQQQQQHLQPFQAAPPGQQPGLSQFGANTQMPAFGFDPSQSAGLQQVSFMPPGYY